VSTIFARLSTRSSDASHPHRNEVSSPNAGHQPRHIARPARSPIASPTRQWSELSGTKFVAFDADADYFTYVDGLTAQTVSGLGHRQNKTFLHSVDTDGVKVFKGSRRYL
jgi:hypothetical protein